MKIRANFLAGPRRTITVPRHTAIDDLLAQKI